MSELRQLRVAVSEHAFFIDGWIEMSRSEEIQSALSESCLIPRCPRS